MVCPSRGLVPIELMFDKTFRMTQTNEHGKVLIENWVEERACEAYDNEAHGPEVNRSGHVGIISTKEPETMESLSTTVRDTFRPPSRPNIRQKG